MRGLTSVALAAGVVGLGTLVMLAGKVVAPAGRAVSSAPVMETAAPPPAQVDSGLSETTVETPGHPARGVGEDLVAQPQVQYDALVREKPREPLSQLGQALPLPEPEITLFYRPVATASAAFESMGYRFAITGAESVDPDETCTQGGVAWPCGMRARAAVRMWLRGRALTCKPPPKDKDKLAVVACSLGKQDVGAWIVSNGWARAAPDGPYVKAEAKAREAGMGIFGSPPKALPPDTTNLGVPPLDEVLPSQDIVAPETLN